MGAPIRRLRTAPRALEIGAALVASFACTPGGPAPGGERAIPATTFVRGCDPARDPSCSEIEQPPRAVPVGAFRIDETEVTQQAFAACIAAGRCTRPAGDFDPTSGPRRPVTDVTWAQARAYCAFAGRRLPAEAEWELAARGTDGRTYPWGDAPPTCATAHTRACGESPADVAGRPAGRSPFGVHDLAGNVDEWTEDAYAPYPPAAAPGRPPTVAGPAAAPGQQRVARGGAWDAWHSRSTARMALSPEHHDPWLGFRCAADPR